MTLPRKGTLARSQYLLDEAFQSIMDDAGKQMFVAGRNLHPGSIPEDIDVPAIAYTIAPPFNLEDSISRGADSTSLFGFEIALFHVTRLPAHRLDGRSSRGSSRGRIPGLRLQRRKSWPRPQGANQPVRRDHLMIDSEKELLRFTTHRDEQVLLLRGKGPLTNDHLRGGCVTSKNSVAACKKCNRRKATAGGFNLLALRSRSHWPGR